MYYILPEIYVGRRFLKDCCYSQQIIFAVAKESLIPYNFTQRAPEIKNPLIIPNATLNQNQRNVKYGSVFEPHLLLHTNINNKNTCKLACKKQCLRNGF